MMDTGTLIADRAARRVRNWLGRALLKEARRPIRLPEEAERAVDDLMPNISDAAASVSAMDADELEAIPRYKFPRFRLAFTNPHTGAGVRVDIMVFPRSHADSPNRLGSYSERDGVLFLYVLPGQDVEELRSTIVHELVHSVDPYLLKQEEEAYGAAGGPEEPGFEPPPGEGASPEERREYEESRARYKTDPSEFAAEAAVIVYRLRNAVSGLARSDRASAFAMVGGLMRWLYGLSSHRVLEGMLGGRLEFKNIDIFAEKKPALVKRLKQYVVSMLMDLADGGVIPRKWLARETWSV